MTVQRLMTVISVFAGGRLAAGALDTCSAQKDCIETTIRQVSDKACSVHATGHSCLYEVCTRFKPGCAGALGGRIAYACGFDSASPGCDVDGKTKLSNYDMTQWQCRQLSNGLRSQFVYQDGGHCSGSATLQASLDVNRHATLECRPTSNSLPSSCDPNDERPRPCTWFVQVPETCGCSPGYKMVGGVCKEDTDCKCDNGLVDPASAGKCTLDPTRQQCMSCNAGYDLSIKWIEDKITHSFRKTASCEVNACSCKLGMPKTGASCPGGGKEDCESCLSGYSLVTIPNTNPARKTCQVDSTPVKTCDCPHGTPVEPSLCSTSGSTECASCEGGYEMASGTTYCKAKVVPTDQNHVCKCPFGHPVTGLECQQAWILKREKHRLEIEACKTCKTGNPDSEMHCKEHGKCDGDVSSLTEDEKKFCCSTFSKGCATHQACECTNGVAQPGDVCHTANEQKCMSCHDGFQLSPAGDHKCIAKECKCVNGQGATGLNCPKAGQMLCHSCNHGYHLDVTGVCKVGASQGEAHPKLCTCKYGLPAHDSACPLAGKEVCVACSQGFKLVNGVCSLQPECPAGHHAKDGKCVEDCICEHGTADQSKCTTPGASMCSTCHEGKQIVHKWNEKEKRLESVCQIPTCLCEFGAPQTESLCKVNDAKDCKSCLSGYTRKAIGSAGAHWCFKDGAMAVPVCSCPYGHAKTGPSCSIDGAIECASCDVGFVKNGDGHCEPEAAAQNDANHKVCTCSHGSPVEGADCPKNGQELCASCDFGSVKSGTCEAEFVCWGIRSDWSAEKKAWCCENYKKGCDEVAHTCKCDNGLPALGAKCPSNNAEACRDCHNGFALVGTTCQKACYCANGIPAIGDKCPHHRVHMCGECDMGYQMNAAGVCEVNLGTKVCHCPYGTALEGEKCTDKFTKLGCSQCGPGYEMKSDVCEVKAPDQGCYCTQGTAETGAACPGNGHHVCKSCGSGFKLVSGKCVSDVITGSANRKACTCTGGTAAMGSGCPAEGFEACTGCVTGFKFVPSHDKHLSYGVCTAIDPAKIDMSRRLAGALARRLQQNGKACHCHGGTALSPDKCPTAGAEGCSGCNDGWELVVLGHIGQQPYGSCKEQQKVCQCPGGMPSKGLQCPVRGVTGCTSCSPGYHLEGFVCKHEKAQKKTCQCPNGTPHVGHNCPVRGVTGCTKCHPGFHLSGFECKHNDQPQPQPQPQQKMCQCFGGTPYVGLVCPVGGVVGCISCQPGYKLVGFECHRDTKPVHQGLGSMPNNVAPNKAVNSIQREEVTESVESRTTNIGLLALVAAGLFFVGLVVGMRTWSQEYTDTRSLLLVDESAPEEKEGNA